MLKTGRSCSHSGALKGIPRSATIYIQTPNGPKPLGRIVPGNLGVLDGKLTAHPEIGSYSIVLHAE